ncbi:hypothetical protein [Mesorhizobium sp.]|jgi:hypothetical protein|uniref:hypothetical protein n=1 Tax=Mesorhizobium sp. TaxID=1871066 RepID=UPI000FE93FC9|nr:hypothetical protein [Mesorhizobium sp.]RWI08750.1 MAG: hypothetical protein EOQ90_16875 [Mesorhizobium sp.]
MTRHVMIQTSAAGAAPPASEPCAHLVIIGTNEAAFNGATCQQHQAEEQRNGSSAAILAPRGNGPTIADISRKSKSP